MQNHDRVDMLLFYKIFKVFPSISYVVFFFFIIISPEEHMQSDCNMNILYFMFC